MTLRGNVGSGLVPRAIAILPVRASSLMPWGRSIRIMASTLPSSPVTSTIDRSLAHVDDLGSKDVDDLQNFRAIVGVGSHLDQGELAIDHIFVGEDRSP